MIALPFGSVQRDRFFEILGKHGCKVTPLGADQVRIERDTPPPPFLEIWTLSDTEQFIYPETIIRISELLNIPVGEFSDPDAPR